MKRPVLATVAVGLSVVLLSALETGQALRCSCNTDRGPARCVDDVCELEAPGREIAGPYKEVPFCAAIRHSDRGDYYSCAFAMRQKAKPVEGESRCAADRAPDGTGTVERCWCNTHDFCNRNLLSPVAEEGDSEEEMRVRFDARETRPTSETGPRGALETSTAAGTGHRDLGESAAVSVGEPESREESEPDTYGAAETEKAPMGEEVRTTRAATTEMEEDYDIRDYAEEKTPATIEGEASDERRRVFSQTTPAESYERSIDTERRTTFTWPTKTTPTFAKADFEPNPPGSFGVDYSDPEDADADAVAREADDAIFSTNCEGGDCDLDLDLASMTPTPTTTTSTTPPTTPPPPPPTLESAEDKSENKANTIFGNHTFLSWFLVRVFGIAAAIALRNV